MGEVVGHAVGGVDKVVAVEDVEEFGAGHASGVTTDRTEDTQEFGTFAVLSRGDFVEIGEGPVEFVAVNVVDFEAFGAWSDEGLPDKMMTEPIGEIAHAWIRRMHVWPVLLHPRSEMWFEFSSCGTEELAPVGTVQGFSADAFRRDLFDNWNVHIPAPRRDGLSPKGGAKV